MGNLWRWRCWLALVGLTCCLAQTPALPEFRLKAKLLMRIADYTEWPGHSAQDHSKAFVIGVLGHSPLTRHLEEELKELRVLKGKPIEVVKLLNLAQAARCQVLFI